MSKKDKKLDGMNSLLQKIVNYKPGTKLKQPSNPPSKVEMARSWKYDKREEDIIDIKD